jgi:hypothetical protein
VTTLGVDALTAPRAHARQPQLDARQVGQRVVLGRPAGLDGGLVPVAAQQRQAGALAAEIAEELQQPAEIP